MSKGGGQMYEYACHEGNYGMFGIMTGARAMDKASEDAAKKGLELSPTRARRDGRLQPASSNRGRLFAVRIDARAAAPRPVSSTSRPRGRRRSVPSDRAGAPACGC